MLENFIKDLVEIANILEKNNHNDIASSIDKISENILSIKTAQYVGVQGYWIRNSRCWGNCYRQKRASKPSMSAQEVWSECHNEYLESINDDKSEWNKYALEENNNLIKTAKKNVLNKYASDSILAKSINTKVGSGEPIGNAIFSSIADQISKPEEDIIENGYKLINFSNDIAAFDYDLAKKLANVGHGLIKEAVQAPSFLRNMFNPYNDPAYLAKILNKNLDNMTRFYQSYNKSLSNIKQALGGIVKTNPQLFNQFQQIMNSNMTTPELIQELNKLSDQITQVYDSNESVSEIPYGRQNQTGQTGQRGQASVAQQAANPAAQTVNQSFPDNQNVPYNFNKRHGDKLNRELTPTQKREMAKKKFQDIINELEASGAIGEGESQDEMAKYLRNLGERLNRRNIGLALAKNNNSKKKI